MTPDGLPRISFRRNDARVKDGGVSAGVEMKGNPSADALAQPETSDFEFDPPKINGRLSKPVDLS
jgi:hypothetical protein